MDKLSAVIQIPKALVLFIRDINLLQRYYTTVPPLGAAIVKVRLRPLLGPRSRRVSLAKPVKANESVGNGIRPKSGVTECKI